jgi:hypothetical protein
MSLLRKHGEQKTSLIFVSFKAIGNVMRDLKYHWQRKGKAILSYWPSTMGLKMGIHYHV